MHCGGETARSVDSIGEIDGWHIDAQSKRDIDAILARCFNDPVSPAFMAPPERRPRGTDAPKTAPAADARGAVLQ